MLTLKMDLEDPLSTPSLIFPLGIPRALGDDTDPIVGSSCMSLTSSSPKILQVSREAHADYDFALKQCHVLDWERR